MFGVERLGATGSFVALMREVEATRRQLGRAVVITLAAAAVLALAPSSPTPDPSDTQCYRGSLYCPPPYYGGGNQACSYVLGRWVTPFGRDCATGSGWHDRGGVVVELQPCDSVPDGVYAPAPKGATA
jgi:hypothetical protein